MRFGTIGGTLSLVGLVMALGASGAEARTRAPAAAAVHANVHAMKAGMSQHAGRAERPFPGRFAGRSGRSYAGGSYSRGGISCVPFARENTGIELSGNAGQWWANAEGVYQRGARPEVGSVMNFRANGRMRMGHVAVVTNVVNSRNVQIDHANWAGPGASRGGISRDITVVDVSEANDWTAVRVALGHTNEFGSVYPTYGFIYDRPDRGTMVANSGATAAPLPAMNAPPRDLRPAYERTAEVLEVAEDMPRFSRATSRHAARVAHASRPSVVKVKAGAGQPVARKHGRAHRA